MGQHERQPGVNYVGDPVSAVVNKQQKQQTKRENKSYDQIIQPNYQAPDPGPASRPMIAQNQQALLGVSQHNREEDNHVPANPHHYPPRSVDAAGITFHGRTSLRTASVFAVAALLLTMAPRADAQVLIFPGLQSSTVDFFRSPSFRRPR